MECACTLAALRGHRTWKVYDWGGGGGGVWWGGIITSMHACGTMWCYVDGLARWQLYVVTAHGKYMIGGGRGGGVGWDNNVHARLRNYVMLQIDRCWNHLKKNCPSQMKNRTGPTINARFWDRIYQWIYRHNMCEWDIASSCEMKKGFANFSLSLDEIANFKNDKTWGVLTRWCQKRTVV